jgi:XTP/dITP diphosphohydrolase
MKTLYFITGNNGKVLEAKNKFSQFDIEIVQKDLGYPEIQSDALEEVALYGVEQIRKRFDQPFFLEDAGLFIDILEGFPGVFSSYVFHTIGCKGILKLMKETDDNSRKAVFKSVYAYSLPGSKPLLFVGECFGKISNKEIGENGFGYDPVFIPDGSSKTFGQMKVDEKNRFSHRGKSLQKLIDYLEK